MSGQKDSYQGNKDVRPLLPLDRIEAHAKQQADGSGNIWDVLARDVLALVEIARAAQAVVSNGARMPASDPPIVPDEIGVLRAALARLDQEPVDA